MSKSETIGQLAAALAMAQGEIKHAIKDSENPFFKSRYADLGAVWDACRLQLAKNKLAVSQIVTADESGKTWLESMLMHASGEWLCSRYPVVPVDPKPQSLGSAITYSRRYALSALVGIASEEDDDGNSASGKRGFEDLRQERQPKKKADPSQTQLDVEPPAVLRSLPDDLCALYTPFNQYHGISFREMPDKALKHIGDHIMTMSAKEQKPMRIKLFDKIKESLVNEIADRPPP